MMYGSDAYATWCIDVCMVLDADFITLSAGFGFGEVQRNSCQQQEQVTHAKAAVAVMHTQRA